MSERFTSDVPAYPDSNYVWVNPKYKDTPSIHEQDEDFWLLTLKEYGYEVETLFETSDALEFIDEFAVYDDDGRLKCEHRREGNELLLPTRKGVHTLLFEIADAEPGKHRACSITPTGRIAVRVPK